MGNILSQILEFILPTIVEQGKYIFGFKDNVKALTEAIAELEASSADVLTEVELQKAQGLQPLETVKLWIGQVEDIGPKVCLLLKAREVELRRLCMSGYCSNDFGSTYRHGKKVFKKLEKVKILISTKPPNETVARRGLLPRMEERPIQQPVGLEMLEATWDYLKQENVGILGLYGMGGVGKTTLLEQIENKFLQRKDEFYIVIPVVVSQHLQTEGIQKEIGKILGLFDEKWEEKTKNQKISDINNRLTKNRFVLLLDDIWRKVELTDIGIPLPSPKK